MAINRDMFGPRNWRERIIWWRVGVVFKIELAIGRVMRKIGGCEIELIHDIDLANRVITELNRDVNIHAIGKFFWMIIALVEMAILFGLAMLLWWFS